MALYRNYWMIQIFPGKSGRVSILHLLSPNFWPSFGKIKCREVPKLLPTDTRTDILALGTQLKLRTAACYASISASLQEAIAVSSCRSISEKCNIKPIDPPSPNLTKEIQKRLKLASQNSYCCPSWEAVRAQNYTKFWSCSNFIIWYTKRRKISCWFQKCIALYAYLMYFLSYNHLMALTRPKSGQFPTIIIC